MTSSTRAADVASEAPAVHRLGHEPALDGLRAIAVVAVLLYHENIGRNAGVGLLRGGFLGVDVFFVLSGFLITGLLLADHARTGRVMSRRFWVRRARRLFPAVFVLLILVAGYAAFFANPYDLGAIRRGSVATLFYVANWSAIASNQPHFTPLSHMWSLAVEEQWYLAFPLLLTGLVAIAHGRARRLTAAILALGIGSFVLMLVLYSPGNAQRVAAGTDTRAWELLLGGALAVGIGGQPLRLSRRASAALEVGALAALGFLGWTFARVGQTDSWLNHGGLGFVALATAVVIAASIDPAGKVLRRGLSWRPVVAIGLISYGLYLYQLLVYMVLTQHRLGISGPALLAVRLAAVFALAAVSYLVIEMPIRHGTMGFVRRPVVLPACAVLVLGLTFVTTTGAQTAPVSVLAVERYQYLARTTPPATKRVLVLGDDTAFAMGWKVRPPVDVAGIRGTVAATVGCGIAGGTTVVNGAALPDPHCRAWPDVYREAIDAFDPAVNVLMVGTYELFDRKIGGVTRRAGSPALARQLRGELDRAYRVLTAHHTPMILLTATCADPDATVDPSWAAVRRDPARVAWVNRIWRDFARAHPTKVTLADLNTVLCPQGNPHPTIGTLPLRPDGITLSAAGAGVVWHWLAPLATGAGGAKALAVAPDRSPAELASAASLIGKD